MHYYEVLVASMTYHGQGALTYASNLELTPGQIVKVRLRSRAVLGIVLHAVAPPSFDVKEIDKVAPFPPLPQESLELMQWLSKYYPAPLGAIIRQFTPPTEVFPHPFPPRNKTSGPTPTSNLPPLSEEQLSATRIIQGPGTFLLHGITGSGKSRVYLELAARSMEQGKSAVILTPEIGLTTQLTKTFRASFGNDVYVLHSQLTAVERRNTYYELLERKDSCIVIGPRSALFSPLHTLGLIVLDEAHDNAYKNESAPHYQTSRVAAKLAALHGATLILGSATPSVEDYYLAGARGRPIVSMNNLAKESPTPVDVELIDLRKSELFNRSTLLSDTLLKHTERAISRGEQTLVFLNRRGTANVIMCSTCGWQSLCPNCDLTLTYHGDSHELRCHICGFRAPMPMSCPVCSGVDILLRSVGTKAIVNNLTKLFPTARIRRFDTDLKKSERLEQQFEELVAGEADIIVGTQMISKGLDLPKLSVVGIVNADSSLLIPDYTAAEQTYQLISQVIGRVGRGHRAGTVIVQSYDPQNTTLLAAVRKDWETFYKAELSERKTYRFPPYIHLLKLKIVRATSSAAEKAATTLANQVAQDHTGAIIEGPTPSFHPREHGRYSWQLLIKHTHRSVLLEIIATLPSGWSYDIDPSNLL